jgi:hypothetical protein
MSRQFWLVAAALMAAPTLAHAECEPGFGSASSLVEIRSGSPDEQRVSDRFLVEVRNNGSDPCTLRLAVARDMSSFSPGFPAFSLSGPAGVVSAAALPASPEGGDRRTAITIQVPANGTVRVPYDVSFDVNWGMTSGLYEQDLNYQLFDAGGREELASQRTRLALDIPPVARVRFSGASGGEGGSQLAMGPLSQVSTTHSPPFAIRVLSTSAYRIEVVSTNRGALVRTDGPDRIPYRFVLDGEALELGTLAGDFATESGNTGATGKVHPVRVIIDPDPTRHAGVYSDRVMVTITPF